MDTTAVVLAVLNLIQVLGLAALARYQVGTRAVVQANGRSEPVGSEVPKGGAPPT